MPTFVTGESAPTTWGTFLLPVPFVSWFNDSVLSALAELSIPSNWQTESGDKLREALGYANEMQARFKLINFNPFPVGLILPYGGAVAPDGYLLCDGTEYSGLDYPELFGAIGYYWGGSGDDFNVPNLINRVPVGAGDSFDFGTSGGEETVTISTAEMPSHSHTDLGHSHSIPLVVGLPAQAGVGFSADQKVPIITDSTGLGFASIQNTGGDGSHQNMPPYLATIYIIYAGRENA